MNYAICANPSTTYNVLNFAGVMTSYTDNVHPRKEIQQEGGIPWLGALRKELCRFGYLGSRKPPDSVSRRADITYGCPAEG